jgi:hypothetical protein
MNVTDNFNILVLKDNNKYIGSLKYEIVNDFCIIKVLYITPNERGKKYAKYLLNYLFEKLVKMNILLIKLEAKEYFSHYNKLVNYYSSFGFLIENNSKIISKWVDGELVRFIKMEKFL